MSVNMVILVGRLGSDVEVVNFESGGKIGKATFATSRSWKNPEGERKEETDWHNIVFKGKAAEVVEKYTAKGSQLFIKGSIRQRSYESKDGSGKRWITEIHVEEFHFLGKKAEKGGSPQSASAPDIDNTEVDDDLPF